jgi:hypothetical protein
MKALKLFSTYKNDALLHSVYPSQIYTYYTIAKIQNWRREKSEMYSKENGNESII